MTHFLNFFRAVHVTESTKEYLADYFNCDPVPYKDVETDEVIGNCGLQTFLIWPEHNEYNRKEV